MMKTKLTQLFLSLFLVFFINCSEDKISANGTGSITGKAVTLGDNVPLENVKISTSPSTSIVFTDALGNFVIAGMPERDYSVQAEKVGFLTQFEGVTVLDENTVNVIFEMDVATANNRAPDKPVLIAPANNATDVEVEVEFSWSGTDQDGDTLTYEIKILNDENNEVLEFTNISDTTYTVSNLQYGLKYFWQVSASDGINDATLSDVYSFETLEFPSNRFLYVKKINGNNVIYSSDEEGNEIQLTSENTNSWRPRRANVINKIAFLRTNGGETHLYTMNLDGSEVFQVTSTVPVGGFNLEEVDFAWRYNDTRILFPSFDKLMRVALSGSALQQLHQTPDGNFISEIDWNGDGTRIALKTNNSIGYNVSIYTVDTAGAIHDVVLDNVLGAAGGLDYSFDGNQLLYTYDSSGNENAQYRQLNTNMFIYNFTTMTATNVSVNKPAGTNDLDPRFSPNEAEIIFVNAETDIGAQKNIYTIALNTVNPRMLLFENKKMPDWK